MSPHPTAQGRTHEPDPALAGQQQSEGLRVPFLGEVPLNVSLRESGDVGEIEQALREGSPSRPHLLGVVERLAAQISIQNLKNPKMPKLEILN